MFAAVLQNNHAAKTIGVRTGGDGCGFMAAAKPVVLAHSQLRFRIPNCVRMRGDSTDEVAGVSPDLPVLPAEGESARQRAQRIVETVIEDARPTAVGH
jgi:C-terminal processing protease CtpA/Prc